MSTFIYSLIDSSDVVEKEGIETALFVVSSLYKPDTAIVCTVEQSVSVMIPQHLLEDRRPVGELWSGQS